MSDQHNADSKPAKPKRRRWWRMLIPAPPDVVALLVAQGQLIVAGMDAFSEWSRTGDQDKAQSVRSAQHAAYDARRELQTALQAALSTPIDQEDLYTLSERIDRVLTEARYTVREAEVLGYKPDSHAERMAERLADGTRELVTGFQLLHKNPQEAGKRADAASGAVHHVESDYRHAMAKLIESNDVRVVVAGQILYRRYLEVADAIVAVADRLWFAVLRGA